MAKPEVLKNILRHELAHMYAHLIYGPSIGAHGNHFKEVCRKFSWGTEVSHSYSDLEKENSLSSAPEFERILSKVKKLLKLAGSSNQHEASLATLKANELLLKYNLDHLGSADQNEEVYVKNVYEVKRANVQMSSLYEILEFFYVQPVINRGSKKSYLEVIGTKVNVEMADYIAKFLLGEFERLYKASGLKGASAKNSFIRGISEGFTQKIKVNNSKDLQTQKELVHLRKNLQVQVEMVYTKMGSTTSRISKSNLAAKQMGKKAGSNLSINKGLNPKNFIKKLGYSR